MEAAEISVVVPVFNGEKFVGECLESVIETRYPKLDIIVIDDGSTDGTREKLKELSNRHSNVRMFRHPGYARRGVSASRNLGIGEAAGQYVCFMDADDMMLPHRFERAMELLSSDGSIEGVIDAVEIHFESEDARREYGSAPLIFGCEGGVEPEGFLRATLLERRCRVLTPSLLVRKRIFARSGVYAESRTRSEDFHLWLRMAACGRFAVGESVRPVALYRRHGANTWVPEPADSLIDLEVLSDVLCWARRSGSVAETNIAVLEEAFRNKFFFCISMLRHQGKTIRSLGTAVMGISGDLTLLRRKQFWGNVLRCFVGT